MNIRALVLVATSLLAAAAVAACSASPTGSSGGTTPNPTDGSVTPSTSDGGVTPLPVAAGSVAIRVDQARLASGSGLQVAVTVSLGAGTDPMALNPEFFQLKTDDGVLHGKPTSALESWWIDGQSPSASSKLLAGQSFARWRLSFADVLYNKAAPTELTLNAPRADISLGLLTATADLSVEPCTPCGSACTYTDRDIKNCGACGHEGRTLGDGEKPEACVAGQFVCVGGRTACDGSKSGSVTPASCVDTQSDDAHCGACGAATPNNARCENGVRVCDESGRSVCGASCVNLVENHDHCGSCGNVCATGTQCEAGRCIVFVNGRVWPGSSTVATTCNAACAARGLACAGIPNLAWSETSAGRRYEDPLSCADDYRVVSLRHNPQPERGAAYCYCTP